MKKFVIFLLLIFFPLGIGKSLYLLKDGFSTRRIHTLETEVQTEWNREAKLALTQPFHYIGRGRQCFAFASKDGKYVLKFPRTDIYKIPFWVRALPLNRYQKRLEKEQKKREKFIIDSFKIAFDELKNQTGILAVHLGQSEAKGEKLTVIDQLGCIYKLPLETTSFILQYRKPILIQEFLKARQNGKTIEAVKILNALIETIEERARKGILNRDRSFLRNYGFDGERAYQIDIGSFFRKENLSSKATYEKSLRDSIDPIQEWLAKTDPEMLPYLNAKFTEALKFEAQSSDSPE